MDMMLYIRSGSLNILVFNHPGFLLYKSSLRTPRDAFSRNGMQMNLFVFVETVEYHLCFILYLADIVCSQYKAESVEPCAISLLFAGGDKNRQYAPERIWIIDRDNINQKPVADVDFQVQHNAVEGNIRPAIEGGKHFFGTVTTEGSLYKGYNVLCSDHR